MLIVDCYFFSNAESFLDGSISVSNRKNGHVRAMREGGDDIVTGSRDVTNSTMGGCTVQMHQTYWRGAAHQFYIDRAFPKEIPNPERLGTRLEMPIIAENEILCAIINARGEQNAFYCTYYTRAHRWREKTHLHGARARPHWHACVARYAQPRPTRIRQQGRRSTN
ncbi:hypothetical protein HYPSUDRAFT_802175 [Hypholoma sublateritium FD-334 SS-4]|uniref:Uncharacterized protein n=1 Tax=Hypholoma sublateritium (strain FD-334 SS-4) TaxID=945553 RepID=A0A0D2PB61_HYPSF|nr:hypothetical protein HYPSUDRAFT_802175 [Hypholoma sublateritium FD-334 SS-4]